VGAEGAARKRSALQHRTDYTKASGEKKIDPAESLRPIQGGAENEDAGGDSLPAGGPPAWQL